MSDSTTPGVVVDDDDEHHAAAARPGWSRADRRCVLALLGVVLLLWAPRLGGPMDLRYDAGVYYILGTSLAEGRGYRLLNEPGAPEAVQYPPGLPALVAAHQLALGTSDPDEVGPWLRRTFCLLYAAYAVACYALARRWLRPGLALAAAMVPTLHAFSFLLSNLLFAEVPYALAGVLLALVAERAASDPERPRDLALAGLFGAAALLVRTAGVALLAAWVGQALLRRRWRSALARGLVALVPFVAWQAHVARVHASEDWRRPVYEYQRAPYQFYNVTYAENVSLAAPFKPELGLATTADVASRTLFNARLMPYSLGESVSSSLSYWSRMLLRTQQLTLGRVLVSPGRGYWALVGLGALAAWGLVLLARQGAWIGPLYVAASTVLICSTPWPAQFTRYFTPLQPFLGIGLCVALSTLATYAARRGWPRLARGVIVGVLALAFVAQAFAVQSAYRYLHAEGATHVAGAGRVGPRQFYYDADWAAWDEAVDWIGAHAPPDAVVATIGPHGVWLRVGRRAVFPPFEPDPAECQRLLDGVPVSYVVVDQLGFLDVTRRYALPAIQAHPDRWRLVFEVGRTRVYERVRADRR